MADRTHVPRAGSRAAGAGRQRSRARGSRDGRGTRSGGGRAAHVCCRALDALGACRGSASLTFRRSASPRRGSRIVTPLGRVHGNCSGTAGDGRHHLGVGGPDAFLAGGRGATAGVDRSARADRGVPAAERRGTGQASRAHASGGGVRGDARRRTVSRSGATGHSSPIRSYVAAACGTTGRCTCSATFRCRLETPRYAFDSCAWTRSAARASSANSVRPAFRRRPSFERDG